MKVTREKVENSQAYLTIEMEAPEVEEALAGAYKRLVKRASIPGFRKGKAPRELVERFLGKESLLEDAINNLVPEAYEKALKQENIDAIAQPQIEITKTEPVVFKAIVPLTPKVEAGDYKSIRVAAEKLEVKEEDVKQVIDGLLHQHATWEPVERPVEYDDLVTIDVESTVEGKPFLNQKGAQHQVLKDVAAPLPGFGEQLTGMKKDEEKEFKLKFPDDYPREGFAGKEAEFKVKLIEVKKEKLPELNDELAKRINAEFETVVALRERIEKNLMLRAQEKAKIELEEHAVDAAVEKATVEFPPVLVEMEIDRLISDQSRRLQLDARGLEEYLKGIKKTGQELRDDLRPLATKRVTRALVLDKVAEVEKVEITAEDIDAEIQNLVNGAKENDREQLKKFLDTPQSRDSIRDLLIRRRTIERLSGIAGSAEATQTEKTEEKEAKQ